MSDSVEQLKSALEGSYTIERELGRGGMATVYLAHDHKHDRKVAIKVLRPELAAVLGGERFLNEIRVTANLQHAHILPLFDSGEAHGMLYYVMPYVAGESLMERLTRDKKVSLDEALEIAREVASALSYAHSQGVVHRDIKPANIMLSGGHAMVTDFGIAKAITIAGGEGLTQVGMAVGTPTYMSPEQVVGTEDIDGRSDIYSLACVVYEMLAGDPPFDGPTAQAILAKRFSDPVPQLASLRSRIPANVEQALTKAFAGEPSGRFTTATDFTKAMAVAPQPSQSPVQRFGIAGVAGLYVLASIVTLGVARFLMVQLGLPDWLMPGVAALLGLGLVAVVLMATLERRGASGKLPWLNWRSITQGGIAGFGALTATVAVYMGMRLLGIGPVGTLVAAGVFEQRERVVLAQFANRSSDSTLGETVTELFRIDLAQSPAVTVLAPVQLSAVLTRMERDPNEPVTAGLANDIAVREGLKAVVSGELLSVGSGFVVSGQLTTSAGEVLWADRETANDAGQIIAAVDQLSASLRKKIGESLRTIRADAPLDQVTTRSTEALRKYAQANRANDQADLPRAIALLGEAIEQDSNFAMAYRKLAIVLTNERQDPDRAREAFTKAYDLRDRLTERERYLAEAAYQEYVEDDSQAAVATYVTLLEKYPTDRIALNNLALEYNALGRREEAEDIFRRSIGLGNPPAATYTNVISLQYALGMQDTARATLDRFAAEYPGQPQVLNHQAAFAAAEFDYAAAEQYERELREAQRGHPIWEVQTAFQLANIIAAQGRLDEAQQFLADGYERQAEARLDFVEQPEDLFFAMVGALLDLWFFDGVNNRLAELDQVLRRYQGDSRSPNDLDYAQLSGVYALAGRFDRAHQLLDAYESWVGQQSSPEVEDLAGGDGARGSLALAEGRQQDAIAAFRAQRETLPQCELCGLAEMGQAYQQLGQADSAIAIYERYLAAPALFRLNQDWIGLWLVWRSLGELYEARGETEKAVDYYTRFVDNWENADAGLQPKVDDVRQRIARLVGETGR